MKSFTFLIALVVVLFFSINIEAQPLPEITLPKGHKEISIKSASSSEYRNEGSSTKYAPESSFDNNLNTEYHSIKGNTSFPVTLRYKFENPSRFNKLDYYPRTDDTDIDGHWKELIIKIHFNDNSSFEVFNNVGNGFDQFNRAYSPEENYFYTIHLDSTYHDVSEVEFLFYSGQEDMITVAEIDFWEPNESDFDPASLFSDEMLTVLRDDITLTSINSISDNNYFKNYAKQIYDGSYNKNFRVQEYKAYPNPRDIANRLKIFAPSRASNVTGIYLEKGDEILVISNQNLELLQVDYWPRDEDDPTVFDPKVNPLEDQQTYYQLNKGINTIKAERTGLLYVQYWSDEYASIEPAQVHFMYGRINGYFDGRTNSRQDWQDLINIAKYPYYDVIGNYVQITFPLIGFKELTDNGKDLIDFYDELNYLARKIHGHIDIVGSEIPNHSHVAGVYKKYKYASPYAVFYNISDESGGWQNAPTLKKNFNYELLKEDFFGTVHEWGHTLQIRQDLNWGNLTETTCNISAYYAWVELLGHERSRELDPTSDFNSRYELAWDTFIVENNSFADGLSGKMAMFWQLYLYSTKVLGITNFYPKVHDLARKNDPRLKEEDAMLNFTYLVAQSSLKDFTNFFDKWNFYKEGTFVAGDYYGNDTFEMTPEIITYYKDKVKALNYERITDAVEYITDNNYELFSNKINIKAGLNEIIDNELKLIDWNGVVVYENYLGGRLTNIYLKPESIPLAGSQIEQNIYAVQYNSARKLVYSSNNNIPRMISLISPIDSEIDVSISDTLKWVSDSLSNQYQVQLFDIDGDTLVNKIINDNFFSLKNFVNQSKVYTWQVKGIGDRDLDAWSETWSFTTYSSSIKLEPTNLLEPVNDQTNVNTLASFAWEEVDEASGYTLQIATDNNFSAIVRELTTQTNSLSLSEALDENTDYFWRVKALNENPARNSDWTNTFKFVTTSSVSNESLSGIPMNYGLNQNYPNPFNPSTQIQYALPEATQVTLEVFNSVGQKVMELMNGQKSAGYHTATFDASRLSSGVYLYKLTTPSFTQTKKMLVIK